MPSARDHPQSLAHDRPWWVVGCVLGGPGAQTASDPATSGLGCPQAPRPSTPSHEATTWTSAPRSSLPNFLMDDTPSTQPPGVAFRLVASPQLPDPGGPRWQEETAILQPRQHRAPREAWGFVSVFLKFHLPEFRRRPHLPYTEQQLPRGPSRRTSECGTEG